jgi:hypothetical protein
VKIPYTDPDRTHGGTDIGSGEIGSVWIFRVFGPTEITILGGQMQRKIQKIHMQKNFTAAKQKKKKQTRNEKKKKARRRRTEEALTLQIYYYKQSKLQNNFFFAKPIDLWLCYDFY